MLTSIGRKKIKRLRSKIYQLRAWYENQNALAAVFKETLISCIQKAMLIIRLNIYM